MAFKRNNSRSNRNSNSKRKGNSGGKFGNKEFNFLNVGRMFLDEKDGNPDFKLRMMLTQNEAHEKTFLDSKGEKYDKASATILLAAALLKGDGIGGGLFEGEENQWSGAPSWQGTLRVNIQDITPEDIQAVAEALQQMTGGRKKAKTVKKAAKRKYEEIEEIEEEEDELDVDEDEDDFEDEDAGDEPPY